MITRILIAGEGGQGIQTIAKILVNAIAKSGKRVAYIPDFGVEQRGTPSVAHITISDREIRYPRFDLADYVVVLQKRAIPIIQRHVGSSTKLIFDSSAVAVNDLPSTAVHHFGLAATAIAHQDFKPKMFNIIVIGKISSVLGLDEEIVWHEIIAVLGKKFKTEEIKDSNRNAYIEGRKIVFETKTFSKALYCPSTKKIVVKGYDKKGEILPSRCKGCGICIEKCPVRALKFSDTLGVFATPVPEVDLEKFIACGNCTRFCPDAAIHIEKD